MIKYLQIQILLTLGSSFFTLIFNPPNSSRYLFMTIVDAQLKKSFRPGAPRNSTVGYRHFICTFTDSCWMLLFTCLYNKVSTQRWSLASTFVIVFLFMMRIYPKLGWQSNLQDDAKLLCAFPSKSLSNTLSPPGKIRKCSLSGF